jgi:hypothetical protein
MGLEAVVSHSAQAFLSPQRARYHPKPCGLSLVFSSLAFKSLTTIAHTQFK